jgi:hypothetical protein
LSQHRLPPHRVWLALHEWHVPGVPGAAWQNNRPPDWQLALSQHGAPSVPQATHFLLEQTKPLKQAPPLQQS